MSGNEAWNRSVFRRLQMVDKSGADITSSVLCIVLYCIALLQFYDRLLAGINVMD